MANEAEAPPLALEGEVGTPPASEAPEGGFDPFVLGVILVIVALVSIQNVWLRRRAERENAEEN